VYKNGGLTLFGDSVLCNSSDTWNIGCTRRGHIDGYCQMANYSIHHPGGTINIVWRLNQSGGITACSLGFGYLNEKMMALSRAAKETKSTTTMTSMAPGFEAAFAAAWLQAVTFVALRRRC
jgi:hypothetical protein